LGAAPSAVSMPPGIIQPCPEHWPHQHPAYFQFRFFPSDSHSTAVATLEALVSSRFASVIHCTYSFRWLGVNPS